MHGLTLNIVYTLHKPDRNPLAESSFTIWTSEDLDPVV